MINMLKSPVRKADSMPNPMKAVSREMEAVRKGQIEVLEVKHLAKD